MGAQTAHGKASEVTAEDGMIVVDGPDGVAVTLLPDAAEETGRRLLAAAEKARKQASQEADRRH